MKWIVLPIFYFFSSFIYASSIDSLSSLANPNKISEEEILSLLNQAQSFRAQGDLDSVRIYAEKVIDLSKKKKLDRFTIEAYILLAKIALKKAELLRADSLIELTKQFPAHSEFMVEIHQTIFAIKWRRGFPDEGIKALEIVEKNIGKDTLGLDMARLLKAYGLYHIYQYDFHKALTHLQHAKRIAQRINVEPIILDVNQNLAIIYEQIGAVDQALSTYHENIKLAEGQTPAQVLFNYYGIATIHELRGDFEKVKAIYQKILTLEKDYGITQALGYIYALMGSVFLKEEKLDSARHYLHKGLDISQKQNENKEAADCHYGLCLVNLKESKLQKAKFHGLKALELNPYFSIEIHQALAEVYAREGNYEKAYEFSNKINNHKEEIKLSQSKYKIISSLLDESFKYEKQREIQAINNKLQKTKLNTTFLILGTLILISIVTAYLQSRNNLKLKDLNHQLVQKNQDLEQFAYITSHDLKEPIRNIKSFAGLMRRSINKNRPAEERREYLDYVENSAQTLYEIVESLRIYTNLSHGNLERTPVLISEVIKTVESNLYDLIQTKNGQLIFKDEENVKYVSFSKSMLILILQNLVKNGLVYNESEIPKIKIEVISKIPKVLFKVKDNGIGIDHAYFESIFAPFKSLRNKSLNQSSGLGLAICNNILHRYNGSIWVESDGQNGSTFYFEFEN